MLVLTRSQDDRVMLDVTTPDGHGPISIIVTVVSIKGDSVRLGFEAPRETVEIMREEVWRANKRDGGGKP